MKLPKLPLDKTKITIGIVVILFIGFGAYLMFRDNTPDTKQAADQSQNPAIITHKDPKLSPADLATAQKRLADAQAMVNALNDKSTPAAKEAAYAQLGASEYFL